jgi:hypothetical protein
LAYPAKPARQQEEVARVNRRDDRVFASQLASLEIS